MEITLISLPCADEATHPRARTMLRAQKGEMDHFRCVCFLSNEYV